MATRIIYKGKEFTGRIIEYDPLKGNEIVFFDFKTKQNLIFNLLDLDKFTTTKRTGKKINHLQFFKHKYERHSCVSLEEVLAVLGQNKKVSFNGVEVNVDTNRLLCFLKGTSCEHCGVEGSFFAVERSLRRSSGKEYCDYHLNLYSKDKFGREILMTADHVLPKSRGGEDNLKNLQTLCEICNKKKGNCLEEELER